MNWIVDSIKRMNLERIERLINEHPELALSVEANLIHIEIMLYVNFALKTIKLILVIMNISYFLGIFWLIFTQLSTEVCHKLLLLNVDHHFIEAYNFPDRSEYE